MKTCSVNHFSRHGCDNHQAASRNDDQLIVLIINNIFEDFFVSDWLKYPFQKLAVLRTARRPQVAENLQVNKLVYKTLGEAFHSAQQLSVQRPWAPENIIWGKAAGVFEHRDGDARLVVVPLLQKYRDPPARRNVGAWKEFAVLTQRPGQTEVVRRIKNADGTYTDRGQRFRWAREDGVWLPRWEDPINISGTWSPRLDSPDKRRPFVNSAVVNPDTTSLYRRRVTTFVG